MKVRQEKAMNNFKKRQEEFESKFSHDEEMKFKIHSRCAKLFGSWAAEKMGKDESASQDYAKQIVSLSMEKDGMNAIKEKIRKDLSANDVEISDHLIDVTLSEKLEEAEQQLCS